MGRDQNGNLALDIGSVFIVICFFFIIFYSFFSVILKSSFFCMVLVRYQNGNLAPDMGSVFMPVDRCTRENSCLQVGCHSF